MDNVSIEEMKQECKVRLELLKIHPNAINDFIKQNKLNKSEGNLAILYWLDKEEEKLVKEFEEKYNILVYHVIKTNALEDGIIYDLLYITADRELWLEEREEIDNGCVLSFTVSAFSESGDIAIRSKNGGVMRIC